MFVNTLSRLRCPRQDKSKKSCFGMLNLMSPYEARQIENRGTLEVSFGQLICQKCKATFPILGGVLILVNQVRSYLLEHVKGISNLIPLSRIPKEYRSEYLAHQSKLQVEHIEEDLEAERVNSLYLMTHYLNAKKSLENSKLWWKSPAGEGSELIDYLIRQYWDRGPFSQIENWLTQVSKDFSSKLNIVELGCGVGGLYPKVQDCVQSYLGMDSSFASISLARHFVLGIPYPKPIRFPGDLIQGSVSRHFPSLISKVLLQDTVDFVVGSLEAPPLELNHWDACVSLNMMDMLDQPEILPQKQFQLIKPGGIAIQSCPYIWHPEVARRLKHQVPTAIRNSSPRAVEWLYEHYGFTIQDQVQDIPWLFFKHLRQIEIYSVHALMAKKVSCN